MTIIHRNITKYLSEKQSVAIRSSLFKSRKSFRNEIERIQKNKLFKNLREVPNIILYV